MNTIGHGAEEVMAKLEAGTHILMPIKADATMQAAIEKYYFSRAMNKGAELKDNERRNRIFAQCWQSLMAYYWMVEAVQQANNAVIDREESQ